MSKKIVVALGGNAILTDNPTAEAQKEALKHTSEMLVELIEQGHRLIITHGNGPQVGNLLLQQQSSHSEKNPAMPLDSCVAMTQGSIGFWLQNALKTVLQKRNLDRDVVSLVTQVEVSPDDVAFQYPTKPVGPFLTEEESREAHIQTGDIYIEDAGRGFRKVVPSPKPVSIVEYRVVKSLLEDDIITISAGGGGVPVIQKDKELVGVEAVIDKDFAAAKLAELIEADYLVILTGVDNIYVNYNKPNQKKLQEVSIAELHRYIEEEQFAPGSMLPKVEAAIQFVEGSRYGKAIITSLENAKNLFDASSVTTVIRESK